MHNDGSLRSRNNANLERNAVCVVAQAHRQLPPFDYHDRLPVSLHDPLICDPVSMRRVSNRGVLIMAQLWHTE